MLSLVGIPRITMGWRMFLKFLFEWTTLSGAGVGSLWPPAFEAASVQLVCAVGVCRAGWARRPQPLAW